MFKKVNSICLRGMEAHRISVEADVSNGLPGYALVGYLAAEVREAEDRVRTAIRNLGLELPPKKVTVNLSPADLRKEGTAFDLAIAAAVLSAYGVIPAHLTDGAALIGELGLDGSVKGIPGVLAMADQARIFGYSCLYLPSANVKEASVIEGIKLVGVHSLRELIDLLKCPIKNESAQAEGETLPLHFNRYGVDFSEVQGQPLLRRAAEVAVAGKHNFLMIGPAGSGKTMVARRLPTIMPSMSLRESIEISKIYSVCHLLSEQQPLVTSRPFRSPHHSVSPQALSGGGARPRPGEISLASGGILFLDELPEMGRAALETLRQPLEEHAITVSRVFGTYCFPANFQLVAAMNPCLCGHYPDMERCTCTPAQIRRYLGKISRPLLDRIDICVEAAPVSYRDICSKEENESSKQIRSRVEAAREIQKERFTGLPISCNGEMSGGQVQEFCRLSKKETEFMKQIYGGMQLSARSYDKILKVARTAADLQKSEEICHEHLCEAVSYVRFRERYWR